MNSEELEKSLRAEFESHLKSVQAAMRQEFAEIQEKVEAEFDKHKTQLDAVFKDFSNRFSDEKGLDENFRETVVEHLRLARDEGARITAEAIGEAEELAEQAVPPSGISEVRDAINDITEQTSQATILKTLVQHAAQFTPRGAFFIIKNEHFVGWRVFGKEGNADEKVVREVFFPVASATVLGEAVRSLSAVESSYGTYSGDSIYLNKLEFGQPENMIAIPLIARGRGVAVLYADAGEQGGRVNVEALETMVRVAGLTVEVLAASQSAKPEESTSASDYAAEKDVADTPPNIKEDEQNTNFQTGEQTKDQSTSSDEFDTDKQSDSMKNFDDPIGKPAETYDYDDYQTSAGSDSLATEPDRSGGEISSDFAADDYSVEVIDDAETTADDYSWNQPAKAAGTDAANQSADNFESHQPAGDTTDYSTAPLNEYQFQTETSPVEEVPAFENSYFEHAKTPQFESEPFDAPKSFADDRQDNFDSFEQINGKAEAAEVVAETPAAPARSRFSDRNVDLPIEVSEDERRLHNDARRFARLLVSEIKLYNEQKVKEGRDGSDLYERLREAIDRSREMYDKRVQPPVAAKFDYFHYELVNTLAEGDAAKLGGNYPSAAA